MDVAYKYFGDIVGKWNIRLWLNSIEFHFHITSIRHNTRTGIYHYMLYGGYCFCESIFFVDKNLDKLYPGSLLCHWHYKWFGIRKTYGKAHFIRNLWFFATEYKYCLLYISIRKMVSSPTHTIYILTEMLPGACCWVHMFGMNVGNVIM